MAAKPMGGCRPKKIVGQHRELACSSVCRGQDFTLRGLVGELGRAWLCRSTTGRSGTSFTARKLSYKKKTLVASEARPAGCKRGGACSGWPIRNRIDPRAPGSFIDETWTKTNMGAASRVGRRADNGLPGKAPYGPLEDHDLPGLLCVTIDSPHRG